MAKDIYGDFYNPTKILSYNRPYCISLGVRSIGKSTGFAIHIVLDFIKNKHQFVYMRRTMDELKSTAPSALNNAIRIINSYYKEPKVQSFRFEKNTYYINDEVAGYAVPLSLEQKFKSIDYSDVYWVIYDEFLPRNGKYLGGKDNPFFEVECLESFIQTCDRRVGEAYSNRVKLICIGNNMTYYNPLILSLGADRYLTTDTKYLAPKGEGYVIEQTLSVEATKDMKNSNVYKMASDKTKRYAFEGGIDNNAFIGKPSGKLKSICNLVYKGETFGVFYSAEGVVWVSKNKSNSDKMIAVTASDHSINYMLIKNWHDSPETILLRQAYNSGCILFENGKCRFMINQFFMYDITI